MALSSKSPRVVAARKLLQRKHREGSGLFLAEGPQAVREALSAGVVETIFVADPESGSGPVADLVAVAEQIGAATDPRPVVLHLEAPALRSLSETVSPQGIVAVCRWSRTSLEDVLAEGAELLVLLHESADPGNAGAIIRVADAAGAGAVMLSRGSVDPTNGKCIRASAGSVFHLPVVAAGDTAAVIGTMRRTGYRVLAADVDATAVDLFSAERDGLLRGPVCWVFGNEAHGLPVPLRAACDAVVRIPILGSAESLNVATAAAVSLYASARERSRASA